MTTKKNDSHSNESQKDFAAFNLTFNQSEFAQHLILPYNQDLDGGTQDKFKKIQGWRWCQ